MVTIKVKTLTGKIYNDIKVESDQTVEHLKDIISGHVTAIPRKGQKLVFAGKVLENDVTISNANIKDGDFVVVLVGRAVPLPQIEPIIEPNAQAVLAATTKHIEVKELIEEEEEENTDETKDKDKMDIEKTEEKPQTSTISEGMLKGLVDTIMGSLSPQIRKGHTKKSDGSGVPSSETNEDSSPRLPAIDPTALRQLQDMGFAENRAKKALLLHKMNGQLAMEWLLMHNEDADIDEPLSAEQLRAISEAEASFEPNPETARQLQEMGFDAEEVNRALRVTRNNQESALAWLLGDRGDDNGEYDGEEKGSDDEEDDEIDAEELVQAMLNHPRVKEALNEPRVVAALEKLMENPGNLEELLADEEIGPILQRLSNLISNDL